MADAREVSALLAERIEELVPVLAGDRPWRRVGSELRIGNRGGIKVELRGKPGLWCDYAGAGGDALALVKHLRGCSLGEALAWARGWLGIAGGGEPRPLPRRPVAPPPREREPSGTVELAWRLWREAVPADAPGSLVPAYLASRGLALPADAPLRFHPSCPRGAERWPAMLALMTDPETGERRGVHRTFLARDGGGKAPGQAKSMLGNAGVVRLVPDEEVAASLGIAEGIETSLRVMQRHGWHPVWAAGSAGGIRRFPVLAGVECLTVFPDADDGGTSVEAAQHCAERWRTAGREVRFRTPPAGTDFADLGRAA